MTLRVKNLCKFSVIKEQPLYCEIYIQVYHQVPTVNVRGKKKKKGKNSPASGTKREKGTILKNPEGTF